LNQARLQQPKSALVAGVCVGREDGEGVAKGVGAKLGRGCGVALETGVASVQLLTPETGGYAEHAGLAWKVIVVSGANQC
jgi:hypothetical protein